MRIDISYINGDHVIYVDKFEIEKSVNALEINLLLKRRIADYIVANGFYTAKASVIYDVHTPNCRQVIVNDCRQLKVNNIIMCNLCNDDISDLTSVIQHVIYFYKDQYLSAELLPQIFNDLYKCLIGVFLTVSELQFFLVVNSNQTIDIICYGKFVSGQSNYVLNVNTNVVSYNDYVTQQLRAIFNLLSIGGNMNFKSLMQQLHFFVDKNAYIKRLILVFNNNNVQTISAQAFISILSSLSVYNGCMQLLEDDRKLGLKPIVLLEGNILNYLYFRLYRHFFSNDIIGVNLRIRFLLGHRKLIYLGYNFYPFMFNTFSDVNFILKTRQQVGENLILFFRLSLRLFYNVHQFALFSLYPSIILGIIYSSDKSVSFYWNELLFPNHYFTGVKLVLEQLNIKRIRRIVFTCGFNLLSESNMKLEKYVFSVAYPFFSLNLGCEVINMNFVYQRINKDNLLFYQNGIIEYTVMFTVNPKLRLGLLIRFGMLYRLFPIPVIRYSV